MTPEQRQLKKIKKIVAEVLEEKEGDAFDIGVMLLTAGNIGPNIVRVSKFCGFSREKVRPVFNRLRANGVFSKGHIHTNWTDGNGGLQFILDVMTGQGLIQRTQSEA